jgi:transcriptional regulator with XRE-family HTH domain
MPERRLAAPWPLPVQHGLRRLGRELRAARLRRRIPVAVLAERAAISRVTLAKVEKGAPGVSMGIYAKVLFVLGLMDRLAGLADLRDDPLGLALVEEQLPQRIRRRRVGPEG